MGEKKIIIKNGDDHPGPKKVNPMEKKKLFVLFAATLMIALSCSAFVAGDRSECTADNRSDETVIIDVDGTFESNEDALKTLGVTDPNMWTYNKALKCNQLELNNVVFRTKAAYALVLVGNEGNESSFALKVTGKNIIRSGLSDGNEGRTCGIYAYNNPTLDGFTLSIFGDGVLRVGNDGNYCPQNMVSFGIFVSGTLDISGGVKVLAESAKLIHHCTKNLETEDATICATGVFAYRLVMTSDVAGPRTALTAFGGGAMSIFVDDVGDIDVKDMKLISYGIIVASLEAKYSNIVAMSGGSVITGNTAHAKGNIESRNIGLSTSYGNWGNDTDIYCCNLKCIGYYSVGLTAAICKGIEFKSDIVANVYGSTIYTESYWTKIIGSGEDTVSASFGVNLCSRTSLHNTLLYSKSGETEGGTTNVSLGIHGGGDLYLDGSVVMCTSTQWVGICLKDETTGEYSDLHIRDSELIASGGKRAVNADPEKIYVSSTDWKYFRAKDSDGVWADLSYVGQMTSMYNKSVRLGYAYDLIICYESSSINGFIRSDSYLIPLPQYDGPVYDGLMFAGWTIDKTLYQPGMAITVNDYEFIYASLKDVPEKNDAPLVIGAVVVTILALVLLAMNFVRRN